MSKNCHKQLLNLLHSQKNVMDSIYDSFSKELAPILRRHKLKSVKDVWKGNAQVRREVDKVLSGMNDQVLFAISKQSGLGWQLSNECNDKMVDKYIQGTRATRDTHPEFFIKNDSALKAFLTRKRGGLNLSQRVWNLKNQTRDQLETLLSSGIHEGRSAVKLAADLKQYLKEPDRRFRRLRDKETGKLILSEPAKNYRPGQGVYRSSYKNALRLSRNEVNIAYRTSDMERRKQLPFVQGIEVKLSNAHPRYDICDELVGEYPKSFNFTGFHTNCLCYTISKLMSKDDFIEYLNSGKVDKRKVRKNIPSHAAKHIESISERIKESKNKPYFIRDNFKLVGGTYQYNRK